MARPPSPHHPLIRAAEWLPGAPLGNGGLSWPDVLAGDLPNLYIYAANNPSESIVAKRRGMATVVSHSVPPYGRAGLYKQLRELSELLSELSAAAPAADGEPASASAVVPLRGPIVDLAAQVGLLRDVPFGRASSPAEPPLSARDAEAALRGGSPEGASDREFEQWAGRLRTYLMELSQRLFSEGLHVLGAPPTAAQVGAALSLASLASASAHHPLAFPQPH